MIIEQKFEMMFALKDICSFEIPTCGERSFAARNAQTVIVCLDGEGFIGFQENAHKLKDGEAFFIPAGIAISLLAGAKPLKGSLVYFDAFAESGDRSYVPILEYRMGPTSVSDRKHMVKCCDQLLDLQSAGQENRRFQEQALLYQLLGLTSQCQTEPTEETTDEAIARICAFIDQHAEKQHSRAELAKLAGLSPGYFSKAFQQHTGKSLTAYLMDIRMARAERLLLSGEGVKETAGRVGFDDEFYFSRRFKKQTGFSPVAFIKSR